MCRTFLLKIWKSATRAGERGVCPLPPGRSAVASHNQDDSMGPGDLHHFGPIKKPLAEKRFAAKADGKQAFSFWIQTLDTDCFTPGCKL
jgi:hypothetical protein